MIGLGWVNVYATGRIQTGFRLERRRENLKISLLQYAADVDYKRAGSYEGINRETLCFLYSNNVSNLILPNFHELYDPIRGKWDYIVSRLTSLFHLFVLSRGRTSWIIVQRRSRFKIVIFFLSFAHSYYKIECRAFFF